MLREIRHEGCVSAAEYCLGSIWVLVTWCTVQQTLTQTLPLYVTYFFCMDIILQQQSKLSALTRTAERSFVLALVLLALSVGGKHNLPPTSALS